MLAAARPLSTKGGESHGAVSMRTQSLEAIIMSWLDAFVGISALIPNPTATITDEVLASACEFRDYGLNIQRTKEYTDARERLRARISRRCKVATSQAEVLTKYRDIYVQDYNTYLVRYLEYGPNVSFTGDVDVESGPQTQKIVRTIMKKQRQQAEQEDDGDEQKKPRAQDSGAGATFETVEVELPYYRVPNLDDFNDTINRYKALSEEVGAQVPISARFGWLVINLKPAKQTLITNIGKWTNKFTKHLVDTNVEKLHNLSSFITEANSVLAIDVGADDYDNLVQAMRIMAGIKERPRLPLRCGSP